MPAKSQSLTVPDHCNSAVKLSAADYEQIANDTIADVRAYESTARQAAFIALRNGARMLMLKHSLPKRGTIGTFVKLVKGRGASERTLYSHMAMADEFFTKIGWLNKKGEVIEAPKLQLLYSAPVDLFTDAETQKREDALGEVVRMIGDQSLKDVLKALNTEGIDPKNRTLIGGHQSPGADNSEEAVRARALAAAAAMANDIQQWLATDGCFAIDAQVSRRLLVHEAAEQGLAFTVGLLTDDHLKALKTAFGQALECIEHHERHRTGTVKVQRKSKEGAAR